MKKIACLFLFVCLLVCLSSCSTTTFDNSLLQPTEGEVSPLLPPLEIVNSSNSAVEVNSTSSNQVTVNSYFYTIWEREVEQNICEDYGKKLGKIELVITNASCTENINGLLLTIGCFGPALLGFPVGNFVVNVEFEIRIYDSEGNRIWKEIYSLQEKYVDNLFNCMPDFSVYITELYRTMLQQAKADIQRDRETIVSRLTK